MATGDKKNALKKLQNATKSIKYSNIDFNEINFGSPKEYLKLYHYLILDYNPLIAIEILNKYQMELNGKNDKAFIDCIYKLMRDMFNYKPLINKDQFFTTGYVELKALMACELINLFQQKFKLNTNSKHMSTFGVAKTHEIGNSNQNDNPILIKRSASSVTCNRNPLTSKVPFLNNHRILNSNNINLKQHDICDVLPPAKIPNPVEASTEDFSSTVSSQQNSGVSSSTFCDLVAKNSKLEMMLQELTAKYESLSNKIFNVEENVTKLQTENTQKYPSNVVTLTVREYENLISRVNLLENELKIIKQQQTTGFIHTSDTKKDSDKLFNRVASFNNRPEARCSLTTKTTPISSINIEKNYDEDDTTLYETPFVSFINNSNLNESNDRENHLLECILAQGELIKSDALSTSLQNDLTPTMDATNKKETLFKRDQADQNSLDRARSLLERASAFNEELMKKVKI